jgi:RES domain-containing protein
MTIEAPDKLKITAIKINDLPPYWSDFNQMRYTQHIGENWIRERKTAILAVPSSIIEEEFNYLLNPKHEDFRSIKLIRSIPFIFDQRIKQ